MAGRSTQQVTESLVVATSANARATQEVVESFLVATSEHARVTQEAVESFLVATSEHARITQLVVEAFIVTPVYRGGGTSGVGQGRGKGGSKRGFRGRRPSGGLTVNTHTRVHISV